MRRSPLNPSRSLSKLVPERAGGIAGGIAGGYGAFIPHLLRIRGGIWGFLGHDPGSIAGVKWLGEILGKNWGRGGMVGMVMERWMRGIEFGEENSDFTNFR